jgi:uncharacterized protein (DUF1499 family)
MSGQKWWAKAILVGAVIGLVCLALGALGTKVGIWDFRAGLGLFALGGALGALALVLGLIALIVSIVKRLSAERSTIAVGVVIAAVIVGVFGSQFMAAQGVPPIHNISTDTIDPPAFDKIVALRGAGSNPLEYDAAKLADVQKKAYPDVQTLVSDVAPGEMFNRAKAVLEKMELEIVNADSDNGILEATATTFWFGFKDDVVVRVRPQGNGSIVDIRSVSRVGQSDVGLNAKRIRAILAGLRV